MKIDSVPEHKFHGDLTYLGHTPLSKDGVVTYQSTISIHNTSNYGLRSGLSATADIYLNRLPEQLAIPMDSIKSKDGKNYVRIQDNGVIIEREVVLGDNDEFWVSIISGISEKESIIIKSSSTSTKEFEIDWED
jgi:HlyD family secretion protein